jgi:hypothetical protein
VLLPAHAISRILLRIEQALNFESLNISVRYRARLKLEKIADATHRHKFMAGNILHAIVRCSALKYSFRDKVLLYRVMT